MIITTDIDLALREAIALYDPQQVFIITDTGAAHHCLPTLLLTITITKEHILIIPDGDDNKNLTTLTQLWTSLSNLGATRHSLIINLGGGVVTDIGAFAAATFKRGVDFVNISTTLLGAVDAATGGKCGINFNNLKNEIGVIRPAKEVIIYPPFFKTLPAEQLLSGIAEMLKHGLISSTLDTNLLLAFPIEEYISQPPQPVYDEYGDEIENPLMQQLITLIQRSLDIKQYIVEQDFEESSLRKSLNFGHTIGHALEELSLRNHQPMPHGYAVMYGMVGELYLSAMKLNFPKDKLQKIVSFMTEHYGKPQCRCNDYDTLYSLMLHDKKNTTPDVVNFTLLVDIGRCRVNQTATRQEIFQALDLLFTN